MSQLRKQRSPCYCINIRRAANMVSGLYNEFLAPIGLTVNQFSLLVSLNQLGTSSVSDLANYVGLARTTVVRTLKPLFNNGMIEDNSAVGQRNRELHLTKLGQKAVEQGIPLWKNAQAEIQCRIGDEKVIELHRILDLMSRD